MDSDLKCKPTHFPVPPTVGTVVHSNVLDSRLVFSHAQRTRYKFLPCVIERLPTWNWFSNWFQWCWLFRRGRYLWVCLQNALLWLWWSVVAYQISFLWMLWFFQQNSVGWCQSLTTFSFLHCSCRALVYAIGETLWRAGGRKKAIVAVLDIPGICIDQNIKEEEQDEVC